MQHRGAGPAQRDVVRTILYIEDQPANIRLIERLFERRTDLALMTRASAAAGLRAAAVHGPDIVLVDLNLPDAPGDDVLAALRSDPATTGVPVVVLSADARPERIAQLLAAGASHFLTKPLDLGRVLEVIDTCLAVTCQDSVPVHRPTRTAPL